MEQHFGAGALKQSFSQAHSSPHSLLFNPDFSQELLAILMRGGERRFSFGDTVLPFGDAAGRVPYSAGMNVRTLQRRLAADNAKFFLLLDQVRRDLAVRYIAGRPNP